MSPFSPPTVLSFAGTDPTGGAGLQADVLTLTSLGCQALSVVTAVTVQDTHGVRDFMPVAADLVRAQALVVLEDMPVAAIKVGMTASAEVVATIAELAARYPDIPLVLDPVLASGRGDSLGDDELLAALFHRLLPRTTICTPNSIEARRLAAVPGRVPRSLDACARRLLDTGCRAVLVTGTHEDTPDVVNTRYLPGEKPSRLSWHRLPSEFHGSGCTLASAIAAMLAQGLDTIEACTEAQSYTIETLKHAFAPGHGQRIPDRLFWARS